MRVNEIFYSLQGESSHAGRPCAFVRLAGCNLACAWCDTEYARTEPGTEMDVERVAGALSAYGCRLVEVTGGEPLLQDETPELVQRLLDAGHEVLAETNGSFDIGVLDPRAVAVVDVKMPSSGEADSFFRGNLSRLRPRDEVKMVLAGRGDYEAAKQVLAELAGHPGPVHLSPVHGRLAPAELAAWMLEDKSPARLAVQLHKILWGERRGV